MRYGMDKSGTKHETDQEGVYVNFSQPELKKKHMLEKKDHVAKIVCRHHKHTKRSRKAVASPFQN